MQQGLRVIQIEDVRVIIKQDFDDFVELRDRLRKGLPSDEKKAQEFIKNLIIEVTRKIEGLVDDNGEPVTVFTAENIGKQSFEFLMKLLAAICSPGGTIPTAGGGGDSAVG
jgi:hypothetical protein